MVAGAVHPTAPPGYEPVVYLCQNILITNIHYYPKQQQTVGFISVDAMYSFWYISNKMQRYTVHLFMENCSTCFGRYLHPSSGAHNCIYSIWYLLNRYWYLPLWWESWKSSPNSSTIATGRSNGLTNTRCCRYSVLLLMMGGVPPETC